MADVIPPHYLFTSLHLQRGAVPSLYFSKEGYETSGSTCSTSAEEILLSKAFPFNLGCHSCWIMPWNCTVGDTLARPSPLQGGKQDAGCLVTVPKHPKAVAGPLCPHVPSQDRDSSSPPPDRAAADGAGATDKSPAPRPCQMPGTSVLLSKEKF